ncbi:SRPBCC family protein [Microbacterium aurantiacum]|uniref:SRPBCC family protein n=1 Tax=Microbacterium aurantiacum TaxID=162393 RepID=UPI000C7FCB80|nr:SRPBCC family protein [Microbacterium aurantiacum]
MSRTDEAGLLVNASPVRVFRALTDPEALVEWLPPEGMTARFERFDARPGGGYRMVLTYSDATGSPGKSSIDEDVVEGRFVELTPGVRVVQEIEFEADDPSFAGVMRMTWEVIARGSGAQVVFRAEDVPDGISSKDHIDGMTSSLRNLAALVER